MSNHLPHDHGYLPEYMEAKMPKEATFDMVSEILKLMCDSTRLRIFWLLCHGEECVANISAILKISSPSASHHLKLLKSSGLIISRRDGKEVYYTAVKSERTEVLHDMIEKIIEQSCPAQGSFEEIDSYNSSVEIINSVHDLLVSDLRKRYTIEELSLMYHINQTTLKALFKSIYGEPIASYMKRYRMTKATELLLHSDMRIADIAFAVGYENPAKFTQAFKSVTGKLPKEYLRLTKE